MAGNRPTDSTRSPDPAPRDPSSLRSARWFQPDSLRGFGHRSRLKGMGYDDLDYRGRPVVAILNTWSDLNTCHSHFPQRVQEVKRGILQAGGFPVEVPVISLSEMLMKPTTMMYRNLLAMETEEVLRSHPIDAAVLMGGCDKTVPGLIMGAISADIPSIFLPAGPMLKAHWRDQTLGSGSDAWKFWDERQAGNLCESDWCEIEDCIARSPGTCMTMGTASTMACIVEAMGWTLPGAGSIPAVVSEHSRLAVQSGRRAVELAWEGWKPSQWLTDASFRNAVRTWLTIGGSTNAIVHLIAMARRAEVALSMEDFDQLSRTTPVLADIRPCGRFLMEDFHRAGGLMALLQQLEDLLETAAMGVGGHSLREAMERGRRVGDQVIRSRGNPVSDEGGVFVLRGNLAPDGCVTKALGADPRLRRHRGPAIVFDSYRQMQQQIHDPNLDVTADHVLVLRSAGPLGAPGFPEWGMLPIPRKLLQQGVRDMVRISDARMSGTSYGTCVLHVSPESHLGGPLACVHTGDWISLDLDNRTIQWEVSDQEAQLRKEAWRPSGPSPTRGYHRLYANHVTQAQDGCDFDFLEGRSPGVEPDIF